MRAVAETVGNVLDLIVAIVVALVVVVTIAVAVVVAVAVSDVRADSAEVVEVVEGADVAFVAVDGDGRSYDEQGP
jgi:hypothetical protein